MQKAVQVLLPSLRSCEFLGIGPFGNTNSDEKWLKRYFVFKRIMKSLHNVWLVRGLTIVVFKYIFARHLLGSATTDMARGIISTFCVRFADKKVPLIDETLAKFDKFPHTESTMAKVERLVFFMTTGLWAYIALRVFLDTATLIYENSIDAYIQTELLTNPSSVPYSLYPLIYLFAVMDFILNRIYFSAGTTQSLFFYVLMNFVLLTKFWKFDEDVQKTDEKTTLMSNEVYELRLRHADLCSLVLDIDNMFSTMAFIFHAGFVFACCTESISLIQKVTGPAAKTTSFLAFSGFALNMIYLGFNLSIMTIATSQVCESSTRTIAIVARCLAEQRTDSPSAAHQVRLLLSQMRVDTVQVTAGHFYSLSRSTMMTTLGAAFSYVSVVVQQARDTK